MCEDRKTVQKLLRDKGELLIMSGVQLTKVRDPDDQMDYHLFLLLLPLKVYNLETKTYTITETHPSYGQMCILSYGENFGSILLDVMYRLKFI